MMKQIQNFENKLNDMLRKVENRSDMMTHSPADYMHRDDFSEEDSSDNDREHNNDYEKQKFDGNNKQASAKYKKEKDKSL